uniref:Uncharacterized protein n=1 Tax=Brassica oleracea var. oleracea TaxID=109376 RepID=A0A0D3AZ54_BRAOL
MRKAILHRSEAIMEVNFKMLRLKGSARNKESGVSSQLPELLNKMASLRGRIELCRKWLEQ